MLQSKKGNLIISLILALILWFYVVGEMNPTTNKTYRNIPITLTNTQTLQDNGMAVVSTSSEKMSITITGKRSAVNKVRSADISATVDVSEAAAGNNQLRVNISVPNSVDVKDQSLNRITVNVQKRISASRPVRILYSGSGGANTEATTTSVDPKQVTVSGARSQVNKVSYVKGLVNVSDIKTSETVISARLTPVDADGNEVSNVTLSQNRANVKTVLYYTKKVALTVPVKGENSGDYKRTWKAPSTVVIKGNRNAIDKISSVTAKTIDLSDVSESATLKIEPNLPDGVELADASDNLTIKVTVKGTSSGNTGSSRTFSVSGKKAELSNVDNDLSASVTTGTVRVTVTGTKNQLSKIDSGDIGVFADCDGLNEGTHSVSVKASCGKDHTGIAVTPAQITVVLTDKSN